jgi:hypothetical protein
MNTETKRANEPKAISPVLVLLEDDAMRSRAVQFCDDLVQKFWMTMSFQIRWANYASLQDPGTAREIADLAAKADMIIFVAEKPIPAEVKSWIELWLSERPDREGALVDLYCSQPAYLDKQIYLRTVAHRAGMDYLTQVPQNLCWCIPDSLDSYSRRADTVTTLLSDILHHQPPPPRILSPR